MKYNKNLVWPKIMRELDEPFYARETGYSISFERALASLYFKDKNFYNDPLSELFLIEDKKELFNDIKNQNNVNSLVQLYEKMYAGLMGYFFCRFKYFDDNIKDSLKNNISTVVNIGAGMDTRAYYINKDINYYEIDYQEVIENKKKAIKKILGDVPNNVTYIGMDLSEHNIQLELQKHGYNNKLKTLFICESVLPYLSKESTDIILELVSNSVQQSKLIVSYVTEDFINNTNLYNKVLHKMSDLMCNKYKLLKQGFNPTVIEDRVSQYNLIIKDHIKSSELKQKYSIDLDVIDLERFLILEKQ